MAKWARRVIIGWTLACVAGVLYGCGSKIWMLSGMPNSDELLPAVSLQITYGFFSWFVVWFLVAIPALVVYLVSPKK